MSKASRPFVLHLSVRVAWWLRALLWMFKRLRWLPSDRTLNWIFERGISCR